MSNEFLEFTDFFHFQSMLGVIGVSTVSSSILNENTRYMSFINLYYPTDLCEIQNFRARRKCMGIQPGKQSHTFFRSPFYYK